MTSDRPGGLKSLDHVIVAVRDLEAATGQYARLLGRSPSWRGEHTAAGTANTLFRLENTYLELLSPAAAGSVSEMLTKWIDARGEGLLGLAFGTNDAAACRVALSERGLDPEPVEKGIGRDFESGAFRQWQRVPIPLAQSRGVLLFAIEHTSPADLLPITPALRDGAGTVFALDHAVVRSDDPEASKALYGERLGLRLALDREFPQWGMRLLFFRIGGLTVELAARLEGSDGERGDRLWGLSFRVRNADAARKRLAGLDFEVSEVRPGRKPGTRVLSVASGTCGVPTLLLEAAASPPRSTASSTTPTS